MVSTKRLPIKEVAKRIGFSEQKVRVWIQKGYLPGIAEKGTTNRTYVVLESWLNEWIENGGKND